MLVNGMYRSENFAVLKRRKRSDAISWILCRNMDRIPPTEWRNHILDEFGSLARANFIAEYCDKHHGGSYESETRISARKAHFFYITIEAAKARLAALEAGEDA